MALKRSRLLFALATLAAGVLLLRPADHAHAEPALQEASTAEEQLAEKYAPIVYVREQDEECDKNGEAYEPVAVELLLDNPDVVLRQDARGQPVVAEGPSASDLFQGGDDLYLDFPGNPRSPGCDYDQYFREHGDSLPRVAYAHIVREPGFDELVLQYWFYYYFNDWNNKHEGDWEMIQLVFDAGTAAEALAQEPASVAYSQHAGGETADWNVSKLERDGSRPVVYPAAGAHSNFYDQATYFGKGEEGAGFGCDDTSKPSRRVELEARLLPNEVTDPADPFAWITFEGRWGEKQEGHFNGPTGPNTKKQWTEPVTWQEGLRRASVKVPETTIFPSAVDGFCGLVAFGSGFLLEGGLFVLLAVLVVTGGAGFVTARRTRFRPVELEPLRQRRQFGQILGAAFRLLWRRAPLFLGIGIIFVPVGLIGALIQAFIPSIPTIDPILDVVDSDLANGLFALALGALQFGIAYWLVVSAVTAAIGELRSGRPAGVIEAYRLVWRHVGDLLRARVRALAVVALLAITVVGIPWALQRAVRWVFLEHAILLQGQDARGARLASEKLVRGSWWRTLGVTVVVAAIGVGLGPAVGVGLILLTSASLAFVNLVTALIYLVLIPWVAIGLVMLYDDLKLQTESTAK